MHPSAEHQITWDSLSTQVNNVDIFYSSDYGSNYVLLADKIVNNGYFDWTLPNINTDQAMIRINAYGPDGQNLGSDQSNSPFVIRNFQPTPEDVNTEVSEYQALAIGQSEVGSVTTGETFTVNVTFKNMGTATWYRNSDIPVRLGTVYPRERYSVFQNNDWIDINRPA